LAAARVLWRRRGQVWAKKKQGETEEELRKGGFPTLPMDKEGAARPAALFAPYPAAKLGSPRAYDALLSTVAQQQMRYEIPILPLTIEPNYGVTTAPLSSHTVCHASPLTDNRPTDDAGPQISERS
jgi:hypothetical protein